MSVFELAPPPWPTRMLGVFRIGAMVVYIPVGTMKLFGFPPPPPVMPPITPLSQLWIAGVLETVGGSAVLLGLFTRPVAFAAGPGAWSLDGVIARSKTTGHRD